LLGFIRIAAGGHFFSDIIFSQIVVTVTILVSFVLYKKFYDK
jgi:membrane-associated phospholipid phosphatase